MCVCVCVYVSVCVCVYMNVHVCVRVDQQRSETGGNSILTVRRSARCLFL